MHTDSTRTDALTPETSVAPATTETIHPEWAAPDFVEQAACAEICAYVFAQT